jgi:predicted nucleic acid-binding Zn ribbon protein
VGLALAGLARGLAPRTLLAEVQQAWPSAVGPAFAAAAQPVAARDGVLVVACDAAVWAQELDLMSEQVLAALNAALGRPALSRLRVRATGLPE